MEKSENTGSFSDFFYQLRFRPAVHQCCSPDQSPGGVRVERRFLCVLLEHLIFPDRSGLPITPASGSAGAQTKLQTVGLPAAVLCIPAMQCFLQTHSPCRRGDEHRRPTHRSRSPSVVFAVVDLHRQDRKVPYGIRAKQVLI